MRLIFLIFFQMSAERRPSFSDIVFTLESIEREEEGEKPIALGKDALYPKKKTVCFQKLYQNSPITFQHKYINTPQTCCL